LRFIHGHIGQSLDNTPFPTPGPVDVAGFACFPNERNFFSVTEGNCPQISVPEKRVISLIDKYQIGVTNFGAVPKSRFTLMAD
jgi:hypothetical protein